LKNAQVGGDGQFAEVAGAHYVSGGGLVGIDRTEARHGEVHIVQQVEERGAELKFHSLVDREVFDTRHIDIEKAGIRQLVAGSIAVRANGIDGEKGSVEVLIHHLAL